MYISLQSLHARIFVVFLAGLTTCFGKALPAQDGLADPVPTMSYMEAQALSIDGQPIEVGSHAAARCADWDNDGDLDLLVGAGDGRLWLYRNDGDARKFVWQPREAIVVEGQVRWGTTYTVAVFADVVGDSLNDLIVGHSDNQLSIHRNIGTPTHPRFVRDAHTLKVQDGCHGRFDVADWNQDGLPDIITGSFRGRLELHRNVGTVQAPKFASGESFHDINAAYNSHPRIVDFNRDGRLDLLLGINWGTVSLYRNLGTPGRPDLRHGEPLRWVSGETLNIREANGDDTTPELADLDGDGVLDIISGGKNGRLFFMRGVGFTDQVEVFEALLARHGKDLASVLRDDEEIRRQIFGRLTAIQSDLASGLIPPSARERLFQRLAPLASRYPQILQRRQFDLDAESYLPVLSAQFWTVAFESCPDSADNRRRVADALHFADGYRQLLVDLGVLFIDNNTATPDQLAAMHRLMMAIPREAWDVETITVADWLGPAFKSQRVRSRTGVNIFALPLGRPENSFPSDAPRAGLTDVYMICLAHELAHNMLDTVGRDRRPDLYEQKFAGLAQAAGTDVVYRSPKSHGIDLAATKSRFLAAGAWDGKEENWRQAWNEYFRGKPRYDRAHCRGNVQFFLDSPQEAFATLANQYFTDSQLMLELCKTRWDAGHPSNIGQFLLMAEYLSQRQNQVPFYVLRPGGNLTITVARLGRDSDGRIQRIQTGVSTADFRYDAKGYVREFHLEHAAAPSSTRAANGTGE